MDQQVSIQCEFYFTLIARTCSVQYYQLRNYVWLLKISDFSTYFLGQHLIGKGLRYLKTLRVSAGLQRGFDRLKPVLTHR